MKQLKADIAIISAGTAGLAAAIAAAENGASVIALEKSNHTGGTAIMGNGLFAVESRLQRLKQYPLTREQAYKIYMDFVRLAADARLVKVVIDQSADTIDWLEGMGVEFWDLGAHGNGGMNYTWHLVKGTEHQRTNINADTRDLGPGLGNAATMMHKMTERAKQLGVQILLKTPVTNIVKEGERITGVLAEDSSKETVQVEAKAVVIATGGYGGHFPAHPGLEGEGIRMAKEVGAYAIEKETPSMLPGSSPGRGRSGVPRAVASTVNSCFSQPNLMVNLMGERFIDEETIVISLFSNNAIDRQKNKCAFSIFDEDMKNRYVEKGFDFIGGYGIAQMGDPLCKATGFDEELKKMLEQSPDRIIVADSIEELAVKTGINQNSLTNTIREYNQACDTGRDEAYGKQARYLNPVRKPQFYASRVGGFPGGRVGSEGIKINYKTEVLDIEYMVISGLYAAGIDAACNIYTGTYPNILPGIAMGFAVNSGRIAGENAAKYALG